MSKILTLDFTAMLLWQVVAFSSCSERW